MTPNIIDIYNEGQEEWYHVGGTKPNTKMSVMPTTVSIELLLIKKKYNFIPTLLQSTKFTDAFWEWMEKSGYSVKHKTISPIGVDNLIPEPILLTGYIIEYIQELL
jgi:hypothetical protein